MTGYVYLFTNEAMPGWVKLGQTKRAPQERADDLYNTSVPYPFEVAFAIKVPNSVELEDHLHDRLDMYRGDANREFFLIELERAKEQILEAVTTMFPSDEFHIETDETDRLVSEGMYLPKQISLPDFNIKPSVLLKRLKNDSLPEVNAIADALISELRFNPNDTTNVPKEHGVYAWFQDDEVVYIGKSTAGRYGMYRRIVKQHLEPAYLEPREDIWTDKDRYQIENRVLDKKGRHAIDKSAFRKSVARKHQLLAGEESVEFLKKHFTFACLALPNAGKPLILAIEGALTRKYNPIYNTSNKRPRPSRS